MTFTREEFWQGVALLLAIVGLGAALMWVVLARRGGGRRRKARGAPPPRTYP